MTSITFNNETGSPLEVQANARGVAQGRAPQPISVSGSASLIVPGIDKSPTVWVFQGGKRVHMIEGHQLINRNTVSIRFNDGRFTTA